MKKSRFVLTVLATLALALAATSCHDNIYYLIQQEVPKQTGLDGDLKNLVPFKGHLYAANAKLYKKELKSSGETGKYNYQWNKVPATCNGKSLGFIIQLAADENNLYCYTIDWKQDIDKSENIGYYKTLYSSTDGVTWTQIDVSSVTGLSDEAHGGHSVANVVLFDNKVGDGTYPLSASGRKAYVTLAKDQDNAESIKNPTYNVYSLNGSSLGGSVSEKGALNVIHKSSDVFTTSLATTFNDKFAYYAKGSDLYWTTSDEENPAGHVSMNSGTIYSMAATKNYILLGTSKGLTRVSLNADGIPAGEVSGFRNNAETLLTSRILGVYVLDKTKNEGETDEYASMSIYGYLSSSPDSFDETGLYAFYPGRGNWNRDGD